MTWVDPRARWRRWHRVKRKAERQVRALNRGRSWPGKRFFARALLAWF